MNPSICEQVSETCEKTSDLWVLCDCDGGITLSSRKASEMGFSAGTSGVAMIAFSDISELEDVISITKKGGSASALLRAADGIGCEIVLAKSDSLFSSPVVELSFYKSKNEYLAATSANTNGLGKVFSHIGHAVEDIGQIANELKNVKTTPESLRGRVSDIERRLDTLKWQRDILGYCVAERAEKDELVDASRVFDMLGEALENRESVPFRARFENPFSGSAIMSLVDCDRYSGVILMSAAIAARLSFDKSCRVFFSADGDSISVGASSHLREGLTVVSRSCELRQLYALVPSNPIELMVLEHLSADMEWKTDFYCDDKGDFTIRSVFNAVADPDRLKFRDGTLGARAAFSRYIRYLEKSFSSDPQQ